MTAAEGTTLAAEADLVVPSKALGAAWLRMAAEEGCTIVVAQAVVEETDWAASFVTAKTCRPN